MGLTADGWLGLNLPLPEESSYSYTRDHGLLRTATTTPQPRQRRIRTVRPRQFSVSVILTQQELRIAESALSSHGYSWFVMPLISGRDVGVTEHMVRLIEPWSVSCVDWDRYEMTMRLEDSDIVLMDRTICFIDESTPYTSDDSSGKTIGPLWVTDRDAWRALIGSAYSSRVICFDVKPRHNNPSWPYASGEVAPCPIITTPRVSQPIPVNGQTFSVDWLYNQIRSQFGYWTASRRVLRAFVDVSISLDASNYIAALQVFAATYSNEWDVKILQCSNERWLRWIINAEQGIKDCV